MGENKTWQDYRLKITDDIPAERPLLMQGDDITVLSRQNILTVIGKAKSKKTFLGTALTATIGGREVLTIKATDITKVLFVDTEQSPSHTKRTLTRIHIQAGFDTQQDNENIVMLNLREIDCKQRVQMVETAIMDIRPDLVIIDGIRDLLNDFNDIEESANLVGMLMRWTKDFDMGIIAMLHQNKNDNNARGHLGTEMANKSETVLQVEKDGETSKVSSAFARNREITPFSFYINAFGVPECCAAPKIMEKTEELRQIMMLSFQSNTFLEKKVLRKRIVDLEGCSDKTADRRIKDAIEANVLLRDMSGYYRIINAKIDDDTPF